MRFTAFRIKDVISYDDYCYEPIQTKSKIYKIESLHTINDFIFIFTLLYLSNFIDNNSFKIKYKESNFSLRHQGPLSESHLLSNLSYYSLLSNFVAMGQ